MSDNFSEFKCQVTSRKWLFSYFWHFYVWVNVLTFYRIGFKYPRPHNPGAPKILFHSFDNCFDILSVSAVCIFPIVESNSRFASSSYSLPLQAFTYTMIRASFKLSRNSGSFWIIVEIFANRDVRIFFPSKFKYSPRWSFVPWHPKYAIITMQKY